MGHHLYEVSSHNKQKLEKRDTFFEPFAKIWCDMLGLNANHMTFVGILLDGWLFYEIVHDANLSRLAWLVFSIGLTDLFDGPLARLRDQETKEGRFLDKFRDWILVLLCAYVSLSREILPLLVLILSITVQIVIFAFKIREALITTITTNAWGRYQFATLAVSIVALFTGTYLEVSYLLYAGYALFSLQCLCQVFAVYETVSAVVYKTR